MNHFISVCLLGCVLVFQAPLQASETTSWWTELGARQLTPAATLPESASKQLTLLAPQNGVAHGQIAFRASGAISALSATLSPLTHRSDASQTIPASAIQIAYLTNTDPTAPDVNAAGYLQTVVDAFIPGQSPLAVVYLSVRLPVLTPGLYKGEVTAQLTGPNGNETHVIPIEVEVAAWQMPAAQDLDLWVALMQSPAQLAYAYEVEPYSEAHWQVIEASTRLLGEIGNHVLYLPVLWHANTGSGPQTVVFHQEGETIRPDFTRLDRYLKMYKEHCGTPRLVVLGVWGRWIRPGQRHPRAIELASSLYLTGVDGEGKLMPLKISSDYTANEALWRDTYQGVAQRLAEHVDLSENNIVLGFADDLHPDPSIDAVWKRIAPNSLGWDAWTHNYAADKGPRPAFFQIVDTAATSDIDRLMKVPPTPAPVIKEDGSQEPFYISSCRDIQSERSLALLYYSIPDITTAPQKMGHCVGFTRIGLDFWEKTITTVDGRDTQGDGFAKDGRDKRAYPARVVRNYRGYLTTQGADGALPMVHFGALQEGVQAAQARIELITAAANNPAIESDVRAVLQQQMRQGVRHAVIADGDRDAIAGLTTSTLYDGWRELFSAAARIQGAAE